MAQAQDTHVEDDPWPQEQQTWQDGPWADKDEMQKKLAVLGKLHHWKAVEEWPRRDASEAPLSTKWIRRTGADGVDKWRIVARGFEQDVGSCDVDDFYASTPKIGSLLLLLVLALRYGWSIGLSDCKDAFYQSPLPPGVVAYVEPPPEAQLPWNVVWKCKMAFKGLKISPRAWELHADKKLKEYGLAQSRADSCVYYRPAEDVLSRGHLFVYRHVDDLLTVGPAAEVQAAMRHFRVHLHADEPVMLDGPGARAVFLGLEVERSTKGLHLSCTADLIDSLLGLYDLENAKETGTPGRRPTPAEEAMGTALDRPRHKRYRTAVGKLIFVSKVRADLQFMTGWTSRRVQGPTDVDEGTLTYTLRYLKGTRARTLLLAVRQAPCSSPLRLTGYNDSDWGCDFLDRRSVTGGVIQLDDAPIMTFSRKQSVVALSSCEAELYAATEVSKEVLFLKELLMEVGFVVIAQLRLDADAARSVLSRRGPGQLKHVELRRLVLQDWVASERLAVEREPGKTNVADLLTKALERGRLEFLVRLVGLRDGIDR